MSDQPNIFYALLAQSLADVKSVPPQQTILRVAELEKQSEQRSPLTLSYYSVQIEERFDFRAVYLRSNRIEIINMFLFPTTNVVLPIYAMEFVKMGARGIVAVIDAPILSTLDKGNIRQQMIEAKNAFPHLSYSEEYPDWYSECRSGYDIFVRPAHIDEFKDLCLLARQTLQFILSLTPSPHPQAMMSATTTFVQNYKDHHRQHSPGLPLLNRHFGHSFTNDFLRNSLFA